MTVRPALAALGLLALTATPALARPPVTGFEPVASYQVDGEVAEIVAATVDGRIDLASGDVLDSWSAGSATHAADLTDDDVIDFSATLTAAREPDAIGWTPRGNVMTANEGDWLGGTRDATIFRTDGSVAWESGASLELAAVDAGFYDDGRSDNKGIEPEGLEIGDYGNRVYAFVAAERAGFVAVYRLSGNETSPALVQLLPTGDRPEGLLAIPSRGLFVSANEGDGTIDIFAARQPGA